MKNLRIKVWESCTGDWFCFGIYEGKKALMENSPIRAGIGRYWERKHAAIRNAKAMAKRIGIKYDPEIMK